MSDSSHREREIFNAALDRSTSAERAAYLEGACAADHELRGRIEALLRASEEAGGFFANEPADPSAAPPIHAPGHEGPAPA
jgi:eukaryotic-like serine/threonine-protein kinase